MYWEYAPIEIVSLKEGTLQIRTNKEVYLFIILRNFILVSVHLHGYVCMESSMFFYTNVQIYRIYGLRKNRVN